MVSEEFLKAKDKVNQLKNDPGNEAKLKLYALYKQATVGKCNMSKPGMLDIVARSKWNAWNQLKNMTKAEAEKKYIDYVNELYLADDPNNQISSNENVYTEILTSIEFGNVFKIVLNRPEKLNALSEKMYNEIKSALSEAENNSNVIMCCLTGSGDYYSSGNDISNYIKTSSDDPEKIIKKGCDLAQSFIDAFINFSKPLIAFVNGPVIGISFTILALFDLVIASEKATFYSPFTKLALAPEGCSSYTFPRLMGHSKACEVLLFNRKLNAKEAYERNIVTEVIPNEKSNEIFLKKIEQLSKLNPNSLIEAKRIILNIEKDHLIRVNKQEMDLLRKRLLSGDFMESVMLFMNKKSKL